MTLISFHSNQLETNSETLVSTLFFGAQIVMMDQHSLGFLIEPLEASSTSPKPQPIPLRSLPSQLVPPRDSPSRNQTAPDPTDIERSSPIPDETHENEVQSFWNPPKNRFRVIALDFTSFGLGLNDSAPGALIPYIET